MIGDAEPVTIDVLGIANHHLIATDTWAIVHHLGHHFSLAGIA
jgi:hypothetical protein